MDVAIADHRLAVLGGPPFRATVEVDRGGEHRVAFDGVEQRGVSIETPAKTGRSRKKRVRRYDEAGLPTFQAGQVVERAHVLHATLEVQQERVTPFERALHPGDQDDTSLGRVLGVRTHIELSFVQRDRERVIPERGGAIDELRQRVGNPIDGIVGGVRVKLDFQHPAGRLQDSRQPARRLRLVGRSRNPVF